MKMKNVPFMEKTKWTFWLTQYIVHIICRYGFKCFTDTRSFHPYNSIMIGHYYFSYFINEKTKEKADREE